MTEENKNGISLRMIHSCLIVITLLLSGTLIFSTFRLSEAFMLLAGATEEHIELEKAAHELMDASDYLTERAQRFTIDGDMRFLEEYFTEAFETNRREEAIAAMGTDADRAKAVEELNQALDNSVILMDREYYAMRLVIEAKGYTDYPEVLKQVNLTDEDAALSPEEKMRRATEVVLNDDYYEQKDRIRQDMSESLQEIDTLTRQIEDSQLQSLRREMNLGRAIIVLLTLSIIFMVWLTAYLGINPVLQAVDRIREDSPIPEVGANEFRYLAKAYNKMYSSYKNSLERLNYKASHDKLTGAYNRAGYDLLLSGIDLDSTYMMLFDVDNFKSINDTYGHETGDKVLKKLVQVIRSAFRDDDYICRVGGDEFVVFMVHSGGNQQRLIEKKIEQINEGLENTDDGLPPVSISVGIVHGKQVTDISSLFEMTDEAMYESKKKGKNTYTFYSKK